MRGRGGPGVRALSAAAGERSFRMARDCASASATLEHAVSVQRRARRWEDELGEGGTHLGGQFRGTRAGCGPYGPPPGEDVLGEVGKDTRCTGEKGDCKGERLVTGPAIGLRCG